MRLHEYLKSEDIRPDRFADHIGVSRQAVDRYLHGQRIPEPNVMREIFHATNGKVRPDDFYDLFAPVRRRKTA